MRIRSAVNWALVLGFPGILGAQSRTVAQAFREEFGVLSGRFVAAAEAMPDERYSFRPTVAQRTFAEIVSDLSVRSVQLCSRISGVDAGQSGVKAGIASRDTLVARLRRSVRACDEALARFDDSGLNDSVVVVISPSPPFLPRPRASAMNRAIAYWADANAQLGLYLRLNGKIPPVPCAAPSGDENCDNSVNRCVETTPGVPGSTFTLGDAPYSVTSDGLGPYRRGSSNVAVVYIGWPLVLNLLPHQVDSTARRSIRVDLSHPVPGDIGVPLGIVSSDRGVEVGAQWYTESNFTAHSMLDIPIGATVAAAQTDVEFQINGVSHALQMGPQPAGHCFSDGTAVYGTGTSKGTIHRTSATQWVVDLPPGSVGRLFDMHLSSPNAVNKGLYYVSLHFVMDRAPVR